MYTLEQLEQKNLKELKEIGWQLSVLPSADRRCRQNWIDALVGVNPPLLQLLEVSPAVEVEPVSELIESQALASFQIGDLVKSVSERWGIDRESLTGTVVLVHPSGGVRVNFGCGGTFDYSRPGKDLIKTPTEEVQAQESPIEVQAQESPIEVQATESQIALSSSAAKRSFESLNIAEFRELTFFELLELCRDTAKDLPNKSLGQLQNLRLKTFRFSEYGSDRFDFRGNKRHRATWIEQIDSELRFTVQMRSMAKVPRGLGRLEFSLFWDRPYKDYDALLLHLFPEAKDVSEAIEIQRQEPIEIQRQEPIKIQRQEPIEVQSIQPIAPAAKSSPAVEVEPVSEPIGVQRQELIGVQRQEPKGIQRQEPKGIYELVPEPPDPLYFAQSIPFYNALGDYYGRYPCSIYLDGKHKFNSKIFLRTERGLRVGIDYCPTWDDIHESAKNSPGVKVDRPLEPIEIQSTEAIEIQATESIRKNSSSVEVDLAKIRNDDYLDCPRCGTVRGLYATGPGLESVWETRCINCDYLEPSIRHPFEDVRPFQVDRAALEQIRKNSPSVTFSSRFLARYSPPQSETISYKADACGQLSLLDFEVESLDEPPDPDDFESMFAFWQLTMLGWSGLATIAPNIAGLAPNIASQAPCC